MKLGLKIRDIPRSEEAGYITHRHIEVYNVDTGEMLQDVLSVYFEAEARSHDKLTLTILNPEVDIETEVQKDEIQEYKI